MYEATRLHLIEKGFHGSNIVRRVGIDLHEHPDVPSNQVVGKYVLESLCAEMSAKFSPGSKEYERELGIFLFFEDDSRLNLTVFTEDVLAAALAAR